MLFPSCFLLLRASVPPWLSSFCTASLDRRSRMQSPAERAMRLQLGSLTREGRGEPPRPAAQRRLDQRPVHDVALRMAAPENGAAIPHRHQQIDRLAVSSPAEGLDAAQNG